MSTVAAVLGFAVLFAGFGVFMGPVLRRKRCEGGGCGACSGTSCTYKEQE